MLRHLVSVAITPAKTAEVRDVPRSGGESSLWPGRSGYAAYLVLLTVLFIRPLIRLIRYTTHSGLNSHILLVPFISAYLLYLKRGRCIASDHRSPGGTAILGAIGVAALAAGSVWHHRLSANDALSLSTFAFVAMIAAGAFVFRGSKWVAFHAFPLAFLLFMIPLPDFAVNWLEKQSMFASAQAAGQFFSLSGTPFVRYGTVFELPGMVLRVAQECSGIRSSWVLFITALLASHLFLRTRWRRLVLVALIIPLGILRNGFRVLVIGLLCVHIGPHMIDSGIHHHGGPLFFALSLIPLSLLLWWLRRGERRLKNVPTPYDPLLGDSH